MKPLEVSTLLVHKFERNLRLRVKTVVITRPLASDHQFKAPVCDTQPIRLFEPVVHRTTQHKLAFALFDLRTVDVSHRESNYSYDEQLFI